MTDSILSSLSLNKDRFINVLKDLIGETEHLQNMPPKYIPEEDRAGRHILNKLEPFKRENGGVLDIKHIHFTAGRGHIIIRYPSALYKGDDGDDSGVRPCVSFVGSHLDVVFADPEEWEKNPFELTVDGDILHGRGTTDCLGHCALLTDIFIQLAETKPSFCVDVNAVIIVDEEAGSDGDPIGVERLATEGELDSMKNGPLIWLDCADKQPNIGSGGVVGWSLTANGKLAHSGFPHKGINSIELANEALTSVQRAFYKTFPTHKREAEYGFECSSSLKPTQIHVPEGSLNQIPKSCTIKGDIRLIPFYKISSAVEVVERAVETFNTKLSSGDVPLLDRGPDSTTKVGDRVGKIEWMWLGTPIQGLACHLDTIGYSALAEATSDIVGELKPLADTGSLPLVADLQDKGFDVQTVGYGVEDAYHADNEFARLSDFCQGFKVLMKVIEIVHLKNNKE